MSEDPYGIMSAGDLAKLPVLHDLVICREASSHDRRGGNDNGFSNKAEHIRRELGLRVCIADIAGPGCLKSAWFGWPTHPIQPFFVEPIWTRLLGRIRFFFGYENVPRLSPRLSDLIGSPPFTEPLAFDADRSPGGFISYVPMCFQDGLRISVGGGKMPMFFYHLWYHVYPHGTELPTWTGGEDLSALEVAWAPDISDRKAGNKIYSLEEVELEAGVPIVVHSNCENVQARFPGC